MRSVFSLNRVKQNWNTTKFIEDLNAYSIYKNVDCTLFNLLTNFLTKSKRYFFACFWYIQPILLFLLLRKKWPGFNFGHKIVANCYGFMWTVNTFEPKYIWMPSQWRFKFVSVPPHFVWISPTKKIWNGKRTKKYTEHDSKAKKVRKFVLLYKSIYPSKLANSWNHFFL